MININLLPPELKIMRLHAKKNASLVSLGIVVIFAFIVIGVIATAGKGTIEDRLAVIKNDIAKMSSQTENQKKMENMALLINDRAKTFTELNKKRVVWSQVLTDLSSSSPVDVRFESLSCNTDKSPNFILIGSTTTEREIIKFKEKLENSPFFKNVSFKNSTLEEDKEAKTQSLKFTLEFDLEKFSSRTVSGTSSMRGWQ